MNNLLFEITPSSRDKNKHRGLGILSGVFASLLGIFIVYSAMRGVIGTWTIIILTLPVLLFSAVSWFVLRFGGDYVVGVRVYPFGIGAYFPLAQEPERQEQIVSFERIKVLEFTEDIEVHRTGRSIKKINVYRIGVQLEGDEKAEVLVDMIDLLPEQILKFRQLPGLLIKNNLLSEDKIDRSKMQQGRGH